MNDLRERKEFVEKFKRYHKGKVKLQDPDGEFHSVIDRGTGSLESGQHFAFGGLVVDENYFGVAAKVLLSDIAYRAIALQIKPESEPELYPYSLIGTGFVPSGGLRDVAIHIIVRQDDKTKLSYTPALIVRKENLDVRVNGIPVSSGQRYNLAPFDCISFHRKRTSDIRLDIAPAIVYHPGCSESDIEQIRLKADRFVLPKGGDKAVRLDTEKALRLGFDKIEVYNRYIR